MTVIRFKERQSGKDLLRAIRSMGGEVKVLDRYSKWVKVHNGELLDSMELIEIVIPQYNITKYALLDPLKQFACVCTESKNEVLELLSTDRWTLAVESDDDDEEEEEL